MKYVAITLAALRSPIIVITLALIGYGLYWFWPPFFYGVMGVVVIILVNVIVTLGVGTFRRGWGAVRIELAAELQNEDAAEAKRVFEDLQAHRAKFRDEELCALKPSDTEAEEERPKLRLVK